MIKEDIYKEWELHPDATQLEIKYKFFIKFIDTLTVKSLVESDPSKAINGQISNPLIVKNWQEMQLNKISQEFAIISNYTFPENAWFDHSSIFFSSLFKIGDILNVLKVTNYKSNQLEIYYEPRMFQIAQKLLPLHILEEWVSMLTNRLFESKEAPNLTKHLSLRIDINEENINNVIWFVENLCLSFKEINKWYSKQFAIRDVPPEEKRIIINIMNHLIVYSLTDFYVKLQCIYQKTSFHEVYGWVLAQISRLLNESKFAIEAYKNLAVFIARLIEDGYIDKNDQIIHNFLSIIKISCSPKNNEKFQEFIISAINKKELEKSNNDNENDNLETVDQEEESKKVSEGFIERQVYEKHEPKEEPMDIAAEARKIIKTIELAEEVLDKAESGINRRTTSLDDVRKTYATYNKSNSNKQINLKSIFDSQSSDHDLKKSQINNEVIIDTSRLDDDEGDY